VLHVLLRPVGDGNTVTDASFAGTPGELPLCAGHVAHRRDRLFICRKLPEYPRETLGSYLEYT
jgi:hypothetical protein